jgi:hypothetical protein
LHQGGVADTGNGRRPQRRGDYRRRGCHCVIIVSFASSLLST